MRWGRLQADVNVSLRRGAWYRITRISGLEATVDVNRQAQVVPSYLIQVVTTPPRSWTVVPRPRGAPRQIASWGSHYAVCPSCRERMPLQGRRPRTLDCGHCRGTFEVDWNEGYLAG